jgi:hypothetical protein
MEINKWTFNLSDTKINETFKEFLQTNAAKWMLIHVIFSTLLVMVISGMAVFVDDSVSRNRLDRLIMQAIYFVMSVAGYIIIKRKLWTVKYIGLILCLFGALISFRTNFGLEWVHDEYKSIFCIAAIMLNQFLYL